MLRLEMKSSFSLFSSNCALSLNSADCGQCILSGQIETSQEVFTATPNLLCNMGSYSATSNFYGFWHPVCDTFCASWIMPCMPGVCVSH